MWGALTDVKSAVRRVDACAAVGAEMSFAGCSLRCRKRARKRATGGRAIHSAGLAVKGGALSAAEARKAAVRMCCPLGYRHATEDGRNVVFLRW